MGDDKKYRILVVDDERSNIDALTYILKPTYTVNVAKNGKTALEIARMHNPDLILLDVVMPDMSGFEVLTELKGSDLTRDTPVIFITGRDSAEDEEKGFLLGAVDYITKPFHNSVVRARVKTHLQMVEHIRTIERLCMIDALTNIPNRRSFEIQFKKEWERAFREEQEMSLLLIDIDKFKAYNDRFGHAQGDVLLKAMANVFRTTLKRPSDFVSRWGGEEFAVLLPNTPLEGALDVSEQIRVNVENTLVPFMKGINTSVTVSIGVNAQRPLAGISIDDFFSKADKALYKAKESGRNTIKWEGME